MEDGWEASPGPERAALQLLSTPLHGRSPSSSIARSLRRSFTDDPDSPLLLVRDGETSLLGGSQDESASGKSSFSQALLNGVNVLAGVGILSLPFAFRQTGWAMGLAFLVYLCSTTNYTGKLIGRCMSVDKRIHTYGDLGFMAYGRRGRMFISFIFCVELVAALSMFITLMGDNLAEVTGAPRKELYILSTLVVLPTCWTSQLNLLSNLSIVGILSSFALLFALVYTGCTVDKGQEEGGSFASINLKDFVAFGDASHLPYAIGLQMVGFAGHAVFPSIYDSLDKKESFPKLINLVYIVCSALYLAMGLLGFLLFTKYTEEELTINLHAVAPHSYVVNITMWLIIVNPFTKFALTLNPLATIVEGLILAPKQANDDDEDLVDGNHHSSSPTSISSSVTSTRGVWCSRRWIMSKLLRTGLAFLAMFFAIFLPSFATICAFVGAFCSFVVSAIFPIMCFLNIFQHSLTQREILLNKAMLFANSILCIVGTIAVFFPPGN